MVTQQPPEARGATAERLDRRSDATAQRVLHQRGDARGSRETDVHRVADTAGTQIARPLHDRCRIERKLRDEPELDSRVRGQARLVDLRGPQFLAGNLRVAFRMSGKADMPDGHSAKRMLGASEGAAIKLCADHDVTLGLGLAEGIENALTAICAECRPVWAAGTAGRIERFPVLPGIEALTIFADPGATGGRAARTCARRWAEAGREARIILPQRHDQDWNDVGRAA